MVDTLFTGKDARERVMSGVKKAAQAVAVTLGTGGSNSLIECIERPGHFSTNDGATILGNIKFADPLEEIGRSVLYEAVSRANKSSGDGSSTTSVLTAAILEEGSKYIGQVSPMEIKRSLEACIPIIEKSISSQKKEIDVNSVAQVASISAEDEQIGKTIQEIYQKIGKEGVIEWDISKTPEDSYTIGTGISIHDATCVTTYMFDPNTREAKLRSPRVLLCRSKINSAIEFEKLFQELANQGERQLLIFCEEIELQVIADLLQTQRVQGFRSVVVKMPVLWRDEWWEDLEKATGGRIVSKASGIHLQNATTAILGKVGYAKITPEGTLLEGTQDLTKHILALKVDGSDEALNRAARLNTKTARYFVGAHSESALAYRRLKVEDAINAASCALENGVVAGGGICLVNTSRELPKSVGGNILRLALERPTRTICENIGKKEITLSIDKSSLGFDSRTGETVDMFKAGIVDPTDVVLNAVKSAIGVAASILTTESVITLPRETNDSKNQMRNL